MAKKRWWVSWVQPTDDYRPLHDPPKDEFVLGWWCSGYDSDDNAILCAVVSAESENVARLALVTDWPEVKEIGWRFIEPKADKWLPSDRFPISKDWMAQRFGLTP